MKRLLSVACLLLFGLANVQAEQGDPKITTIEAIAFGPDGLLLVGGGARVVAVETGDTTPTKWSKTEIQGIDQAMAGKLGLSTKDVEIRDLAVNPASRKAYVAVKSLKTNDNVILTIDGSGKVGEFALDNVKYTSYDLKAPVTITKVTDIAWAGGRIVASTQATDKFTASRVFTIDPKAKDATQISTKTFHVGHNKWETSAPLRVLTPFYENGKTSVVGSFTCTPVVRYDLDDVKNDQQVVGNSVVELGTGNTPRSMFAYERDGKQYLLVSVGRNNKKPAFGFPSAYWVARVDAELLNETTNVNEKAPWRDGVAQRGAKEVGGRVQVAKDYFGTLQVDKLDDQRAIAIVEANNGMSLRVIPLP
jgi:hypothetical protein